MSLYRATPTVGQFIFWIFLRGFEAFKYLHMGMISEIKPKTLPAIAKVVGLDNHQPLHHFLTVSPWDIKLLRDLQVINCPTVSQNFRAKPRRVVVSLDRATPTVGQFIFWIFLTEIRLQLILDILSGRPIILMIDETGDKKKGKSTDYVKRQYIGNLGKTDNGIVAVTAYAVFCGMTFPLTFEIYKPRERLKEGDKYLTKPQIAAQMIKELGTCK